jgi:hypothetical protein
MTTIRRSILASFVLLAAPLALTGCSGQDEGQPPVGSISAEGDKTTIPAKPVPAKTK